jgi:hypothetical protein
MDQEYVGLLKLYIEKTLGRRVLSSTDCRFLFNDINQQIDATLSFNTLRRFFNLMETKHEQSVYTLNILASYCGFLSFDDFKTSVKHKPSENGMQNADLLHYLVMLFKETEVVDPNDATFSRLVRQTITFLEFHPELIDQFQREIAKTSNGQTFYYEQFVNFDRLNGYYGDGLRYYLHEKKNVDAQVFGHYMLCLRYWLTMNNKNLEKHYHQIMHCELNKKSSASTVAHYYAAQLMHAHTFQTDPEPVLIKTRQYYSTISQAKDFSLALFRFYMTMSHTLLLTEQYDEALFYIEEFLKNRKKFELRSMERNFSESILLFKAVAMLHLGNKPAAREWLESVNSSNFFVLSKQYNTILYLSLKQHLKKSSYEQEQLKHLVKITGFVRLMQAQQLAAN